MKMRRARTPLLPSIRKSQLQLASDSEVMASWQRMEQRFLSETPKVFAQWEQATGFSFSEQALLGSTVLRPFLQPVSCYMHDWMHGVVANGTLNIVGYLFLQAMQKQGLQSWSSFRDYLGFWVLPAASKKHARISQVCLTASGWMHARRAAN